MRLFDLVEHEHRMRRSHDRLGQQSALIKADISRRRADQPRNRVRLGVFAHVEANELDAEHLGKLLRNLGLADAGRAREKERADRFRLVPKSGTRDLDRVDDRVDRLVLAEDRFFDIVAKRL